MAKNTGNEKRDWKKALLAESATVKQAIENINESALQIAMVVADDGFLTGTITDGDIRRGLLRGLDMSSSVDKVVHRNPMVVPPEMNREMVLHLMRVNKITRIPVVDANRRVIGLHLWDEIDGQASRPNAMVIMAGGLGTRLRPYTEKCPKSLLPVAGKPMLEHIIERARADGFENFVLAIHHLGKMIEEYFGDGRRCQVNIDYLREERPLGTAGALSLLDSAYSVPIVVTNGDVLTNVRYGEIIDFHNQQKAVATMAVRLHEWEHPFGVVRTEGIDIVNFEEKPVYRTHVNAGIYVLEPEALDLLDKNEHCDMPCLFRHLKKKGKRTVVYLIHEPWLDVGREADFKLANNTFNNLDQENNLYN